MFEENPEEHPAHACAAGGSELAAWKRREAQDIDRQQESIDRRRADVETLGGAGLRLERGAAAFARVQRVAREHNSKQEQEKAELQARLDEQQQAISQQAAEVAALRRQLGNSRASAAEVERALAAALADLERCRAQPPAAEAAPLPTVTEVLARHARSPASASIRRACHLACRGAQ